MTWEMCPSWDHIRKVMGRGKQLVTYLTIFYFFLKIFNDDKLRTCQANTHCFRIQRRICCSEERLYIKDDSYPVILNLNLKQGPVVRTKYYLNNIIW